MHIHSANSESASDTAIKKYRFLVDGFYDYDPTQRVHVSDMEEAMLETIRKREEYMHRSDSDFVVCTYEVRLSVCGSECFLHACLLQCAHLPAPDTPSDASRRKAYEVIDDKWLDENAIRLFPRRPLATLKEGHNVLAVLSRLHSKLCNGYH